MATDVLMKEKEYKDMWEMCVEHPFIKQMVKNELEHDKFRDYIIQDKIFCETFRGFVCSVLADCTDADDFEAVHKLVADLQGYSNEARMFKEIFDGLKISHADMRPHPTTEAFCNFLWRVSTTGTLADKLVVLYAIEASYMEWAERSIKANQRPSDPMFSKWVEIHSAKNLGKLVDWCKSRLNELVGSSGEGLTHHHHHLFRRSLQHEIMLWDTAHRPGSSVFPGEFGVGHHARASEMTYLGKLISGDQELWDSIVQHQLLTEMFTDSLPMDRFRDYMIQTRFIALEGVRTLLCRLLADCRPEHSAAQSILSHIQALQPGGDHFESISGVIDACGPPHASMEALPATQALCDMLFRIGVSGSVHEKILALATLSEVTRARFEQSQKPSVKPKNQAVNMWWTHHGSAGVSGRVQWLHAALDSSVESGGDPSPTDRHLFRRIIQWVILINDSVRNRSLIEWPLNKYYHRRELVSKGA